MHQASVAGTSHFLRWPEPSVLIGAGLLHNPVLELAALSLAAVGIWGTLGPFWALSSESLAGAGALPASR
jgi:hypothetical protein